MLLHESRVQGAGDEVNVIQHLEMERYVSAHTDDLELLESAAHPPDGLSTVTAPLVGTLSLEYLRFLPMQWMSQGPVLTVLVVVFFLFVIIAVV